MTNDAMKLKADFSKTLRSILGRDVPETGPGPVLTAAEMARLRAHPELLVMEFQDIVDAEPEQARAPQSMAAQLKFDDVAPITEDFLLKRAKNRTPSKRPPGAPHVEVTRSGRPVPYSTGGNPSLAGRLFLDAASMPTEELARTIARNLRHQLKQRVLAVGRIPEPVVVVINVEHIQAPQHPVRYGALIGAKARHTNKVFGSSAKSETYQRRKQLLKQLGKHKPVESIEADKVSQRLLVEMVRAKLPAGHRSAALVRKIKFESVDS